MSPASGYGPPPGRAPGPEYGPRAGTVGYGPAPGRSGPPASGPPATAPVPHGPAVPYGPPVSYGPPASHGATVSYGPPVSYGPRAPAPRGPSGAGGTVHLPGRPGPGYGPESAGTTPGDRSEPEPEPRRDRRSPRPRRSGAGWLLPGAVVVVALFLGLSAFLTLASLDLTDDDVLATAGAWLTISAVLGGLALLLLLVTPVVAILVRRAWAVVAAVLSVLAPLAALYAGVHAGVVVATDNATDGLDDLGALVSRTADLVERRGGDGGFLRDVARTIDGT